MILSCQNIVKSFVGKEILKNISFHIEDHEKAAVVGINGAGKSTLLKIIMGEQSSDSGIVTISKGSKIGYLAQQHIISETQTIYDEVLSVKKEILDIELQIRQIEHQMKSASSDELELLMSKYTNLTHLFESNNGYACRSEIIGVLKGLGFEESEFNRKLSELSGGQKTRVALGKLLLTKPDLLILDEPTNHLDLTSTCWLENYLLNYDGAVLIVAHDRYFLDKVVTKVIEIDNGISTVFSGNYTAYAQKKELLRDAQLKAYLNQQREIKHQEAVIEKLRSFNREKSIKRADSREKQLQKMNVIEKPIEVNDQMRIHLEPQIISGNDVLTISNLSKSFDSLTLFQNVDIQIKRGERLAVIGNNGTGKTTLLKIINQMIDANEGTIQLGSNVHIAYYDQEHQVLHPEKTLFEEISDTYPSLDNTKIRNVLASFLFTGEDVFKKIHELSGGERGRVSLAKLMLSEANFLILDEPTNHLDIVSKEILETALNHYSGTILYVSHDRYFINKTATRILDLVHQTFINYIGNYDYYLEKKDTLTNNYLASQEQHITRSYVSKESDSKTDWKLQKEQQAKLRKIQNEIQRLETNIEKTETRISEIDDLMTQESIYTNVSECMKLNKEKESLESSLLEYMEQWEALSSQLE